MPLFSRTFISALAVLSIGLSIVLSWVNSADDVCPYRRERSKLDSDQQQRTYLINGEVDASRHQMDVVVVAGAWRRPNGTLSRGFRHRVVHGVRMAMLFGAKDVLFTGGLNDSAVALEFVGTLQDASNVLFPLPWVLVLDDDARDVAMDLKAQLSPYDHLPLAEVLQRVGLAQQAAPPLSTAKVGRHQHDAAFQWPQFHIENASLTTFGNAVHTKKWWEGEHGEQLVEGSPRCEASLHVLVVSSQYHNRRCKMLFTKVLRQKEATVPSTPSQTTGGVCGRRDEPHKYVHVVTSGAIGSMLEVVLPEEWISFASVPSPSMERVPFVPRWFKIMCKTVYLTYRNWRSHLDVTMYSIDSYAFLRELGAFGKAVVQGLITPREFITDIFG
ncbi:GPI-anchored surface protein, putative [Bodo saltans]|uniref:GPI-anchored surface protein, putative n=1 Tax=Bodo saltans TaxID=75058 RepID=A0A0S4JE38_BODSA|nr:GPI-anchored surface protein, putative [Bodo saltans]|eukprot:CUG87435.1 GPI-anchored surface protein, putative [Bodo saltans]